MHLHDQSEPMNPLFRPGVVIWRGNLRFTKHSAPTLAFFPLVENERNGVKTKVMRISLLSEGLSEPTANDKFGIVCFVSGKCDPNWTHIVINGSALKADGGCVYAEFAKPLEMKNYLEWRKHVADSKMMFMDNFDNRIKLAQESMPPIKVGDMRLLVKNEYNTLIRYAHVPKVFARPTVS